MSATATTPHHHRVPLATALAVAAAITAAGALGFAWVQSHDSSKPAETPVVNTQPQALKGQTGEVPNARVAEGQLSLPRTPASEVPNARVAEGQLSVPQTRPSEVPNARIAEQQQQSVPQTGPNDFPNAHTQAQERLQAFQSPPGGKVQPGE
jgi:hypothetical protein